MLFLLSSDYSFSLSLSPPSLPLPKKHHQSTPDLQEKVSRLEKENEGLRKELRAAQNSDFQYTSVSCRIIFTLSSKLDFVVFPKKKVKGNVAIL